MPDRASCCDADRTAIDQAAASLASIIAASELSPWHLLIQFNATLYHACLQAGVDLHDGSCHISHDTGHA